MPMPSLSPEQAEAMANAVVGFDLGAVANVDALGNPTGVPNMGTVSPNQVALGLFGNQISPLNPTFSITQNPPDVHGYPAFSQKGIPMNPDMTFTPEAHPLSVPDPQPNEPTGLLNFNLAQKAQIDKEFALQSALQNPQEAFSAIQNQALAQMTFNAYQDAVVANQTAPMSFADALNATLASMNPAMSAPDDDSSSPGFGPDSGTASGNVGGMATGGGPASTGENASVSEAPGATSTGMAVGGGAASTGESDSGGSQGGPGSGSDGSQGGPGASVGAGIGDGTQGGSEGGVGAGSLGGLGGESAGGIGSF